MRRGLMAWSKEELPPAVLEARCARVQAAMRRAGLDALLVHTSFPRPAAVSWLTNFVPYWSEALLILRPQGRPVLLAALSKRVHDWVREVSHVGDILPAPHLGRKAAEVLDRELAGTRPRIGVVELAHFAHTHAEPLRARFCDGTLEDASALFAHLRQPADAAEVALAEKAAAIATAALAAVPPAAGTVADLAAPLETGARAAGAEECLILAAPDLGADSVLCRVDGDAHLGARFAVQVSVAYKGVWVRQLRSFAASTPPPSWQAAEEWFRSLLPILGAGDLVLWPRRAPELPGRLAGWTVEACTGATPLSVAAADGRLVRPLPAGSLAVLTVRIETADGPWLCAAPLVLDAAGASRLLVACT